MKKLKIGISTLYLITEHLEDAIKRILKLNTELVEIVDDGLHALNKRRVKFLKELASTYELEFSVHAPFADINIAALDNSIRKIMMKKLEKSLQLVSQLEAKVWVFHPGVKTGLTYFYPEKEWKNNVNSAKHLSKVANEFNVQIAIENLPPPYPLLMRNVDGFLRFYDEVTEDIGIALDIGHANLNGEIELFLEVFKDKIVHMHASDNDGRNDLHLGIGEGTVNWTKVAEKIKEIKFNRGIVVESVQKVEESLETLRKFFSNSS